ncbi:hypothetical protein C0Q70_16217 [Pomacea canaliculata]|uniref:Uncharacterized protein n=1 Tax=Pomacea canaliculata TaxID=400727 RepID=A0A2T7NP60_POMCA|nr:hypothetical protein C0Q70_16217 [Pomacea canaliculata]
MYGGKMHCPYLNNRYSRATPPRPSSLSAFRSISTRLYQLFCACLDNPQRCVCDVPEGRKVALQNEGRRSDWRRQTGCLLVLPSRLHPSFTESNSVRAGQKPCSGFPHPRGIGKVCVKHLNGLINGVHRRQITVGASAVACFTVTISGIVA